jgi:hypothetical protein
MENKLRIAKLKDERPTPSMENNIWCFPIILRSHHLNPTDILALRCSFIHFWRLKDSITPRFRMIQKLSMISIIYFFDWAMNRIQITIFMTDTSFYDPESLFSLVQTFIVKIFQFRNSILKKCSYSTHGTYCLFR